MAHENPHRFVSQTRSEMLPGALAVRLAALGRIDSRKPDPVLVIRSVENRDRIAVGNPDDLAEKLGCRGRVAEREKQCRVDET